MDILQKIDFALKNFDIDDYVHHPTQMHVAAELVVTDLTQESDISDDQLERVVNKFVEQKVKQMREYAERHGYNNPLCVICGSRYDHVERMCMCEPCLDSLSMDYHTDYDFEEWVRENNVETVLRPLDEDGCFEPLTILHNLFSFK